jgi:hypothetical protein
VGGMLTASDLRGHHVLEQPTQELILRKITGVVLLPGSVVVMS